MSAIIDDQRPINTDRGEALLCRKGSLDVIRCFDAELGRQVVVKRYGPGRELGMLISEAEVMRRVDHPNVLGCHGYRPTEAGGFEIILESGVCSLANLVRRGQGLSEQEIMTYFTQIAAGLAAIHAQGIIHRDIKCDNIIMVEVEGVLVAKIADFGEATFVTAAPSTRGTANFMAPEVCRGLSHSCASDIWSLGATLYEMAARQYPFHDLNNGAIIYQVAIGKLTFPLTQSELFNQLIQACQAALPEHRPSAAQLCRHFIAAGY